MNIETLANTIHSNARVEGDVIAIGDFTLRCTLTGKIVAERTVNPCSCGSRVVGTMLDSEELVASRFKGFAHFCCS